MNLLEVVSGVRLKSKALQNKFSAYGSSNYPGTSFWRTPGVQSTPGAVFGVQDQIMLVNLVSSVVQLESKAFRKRFSAYGSSNYPGSSFRRTVESKTFRKRFSAYESSNYPGRVFGVLYGWSPKHSGRGFRRQTILE